MTTIARANLLPLAIVFIIIGTVLRYVPIQYPVATIGNVLIIIGVVVLVIWIVLRVVTIIRHNPTVDSDYESESEI